jgi:hypothetical protein
MAALLLISPFLTSVAYFDLKSISEVRKKIRPLGSSDNIENILTLNKSASFHQGQPYGNSGKN